MKNILLPILLITAITFAQRGIPPKDVVNITATTKYPTHVDFKPEMVKQLRVPQGWEGGVAASGLGKPRTLYLGKQGQLYVTRRDVGDVMMLKDTEKDGQFDDIKIIVADFKGVHGITIKDDRLYLCNNNELRRYKLNPDGTADIASKQMLFEDMPSGGQHPNRTMDWGPDGMLYITIGSPCNDCIAEREYATIVQVDPLTWKRTIYASGLRNTIGFDWNPQTKELWGLDHGCDMKGDTWPPEELNKIEKNADYGFPFAYGKREIDKTREDPPGSSKDEKAAASMPSTMEFPAHSAPMAFQFFESGPFAGDGLVTWHGSWNAEKPVGFKVERVQFRNGKPEASSDFLSGFLINNDKDRFGRPVGIAIAADNTVYISDDANGVIYSVKPKK